MSRREIHHIALPVADLTAAESFYVDLLQLPLLRYQNDENGRKRAVWIDLDRVILMLEKGSAKKTVAKSSTVLAFTIKADQRAYWLDRLKGQRVKITGTSDYSIYFNDADGHRLALSHYPDKAA